MIFEYHCHKRDGKLLIRAEDSVLVVIDMQERLVPAMLAPANTLNLDASAAQTGTWEGSFSGPAGQEIVGYIVIEGDLSDAGLDPSYDPANAVEGREVGGFVVAR